MKKQQNIKKRDRHTIEITRCAKEKINISSIVLIHFLKGGTVEAINSGKITLSFFPESDRKYVF